MVKLGTYSTIDYPSGDNISVGERAFAFLKKEFSKIGGSVRKVTNPHDFGEYFSFEIDYPEGFYEESEETRDQWHGAANNIEEDYGKEFEKYL